MFRTVKMRSDMQSGGKASNRLSFVGILIWRDVVCDADLLSGARVIRTQAVGQRHADIDPPAHSAVLLLDEALPSSENRHGISLTGQHRMTNGAQVRLIGTDLDCGQPAASFRGPFP